MNLFTRDVKKASQNGKDEQRTREERKGFAITEQISWRAGSVFFAGAGVVRLACVARRGVERQSNESLANLRRNGGFVENWPENSNGVTICDQLINLGVGKLKSKIRVENGGGE